LHSPCIWSLPFENSPLNWDFQRCDGELLPA
jgi:hypothetical protein